LSYRDQFGDESKTSLSAGIDIIISKIEPGTCSWQNSEFCDILPIPQAGGAAVHIPTAVAGTKGQALSICKPELILNQWKQ
jgi:hypothetical protein